MHKFVDVISSFDYEIFQSGKVKTVKVENVNVMFMTPFEVAYFEDHGIKFAKAVNFCMKYPGKILTVTNAQDGVCEVEETDIKLPFGFVSIHTKEE